MLLGKFTAVIFSSTSGAAVTLLWLLINITHAPSCHFISLHRSKGKAAARRMEGRLQPDFLDTGGLGVHRNG